MNFIDKNEIIKRVQEAIPEPFTIFKTSMDDFSMTKRGYEAVRSLNLFEKEFHQPCKINKLKSKDIKKLGEAFRAPYYVGEHVIDHFDEPVHITILLCGSFQQFLDIS